MKRLCLLFSFVAVLCFGQDHYIGFTGGYSYSSANILSGTSGNTLPQHLYFGELNYQFHPESWFYFNIGLRYDRKGFQLNDEHVVRMVNDAENQSDTLGNYTYDFHKVGVPLKIGFKLGGKVFFQFAMGVIPSYSILSNASWTLNYQGTEIENASIGNWTNIKNFELPWIGEIGFGAHLGENVMLNFLAGYTQSLTKHLLPNQVVENNVVTTDFRTVRFKGIHASIGLYFRLHKKQQKLQKFTPSSE